MYKMNNHEVCAGTTTDGGANKMKKVMCRKQWMTYSGTTNNYI